ncbi:hypothetical protein [Anabaena sp. CA = ATCC 33047]|uniref:hypothetical protein n=1 Tax=Anabaena sp. (strain CA / ATCC 33047) TaxID=52271 RepID=UPI00082C058C|nr:hypothetical protein [Anabaena sp. CA = ATCC 33047]
MIKILPFFTEVTAEESAHIGGGFVNESPQPILPFLQEKENNYSRIIRPIFGDNAILASIFTSRNSVSVF